jgi:hypothetical protein
MSKYVLVPERGELVLLICYAHVQTPKAVLMVAMAEEEVI